MASKKELRKLRKEQKLKEEEPKPSVDETEPSTEDIPETMELDDSDPDQTEGDLQESDQEEDESDVQSDSDEQEEGVEIKKKIFPNDQVALLRLRDEIKLKNLPWIETMSVTSKTPLAPLEDELAMEQAFYQQALEAALIGRKMVLEADTAFTRPSDYYAEMIKSDEHMARLRQKLVNEEARIVDSENRKKQRLLKKHGKKVQVEKQLERQRQKTDSLEKIKMLKRKRKDGAELTLDDDFDVALEAADKSKKGAKQTEKPTKRATKDAKYGFGGKKGKHHKSNTAASSGETGGYSKMKGLSPRTKKARR